MHRRIYIFSRLSLPSISTKMPNKKSQPLPQCSTCELQCAWTIPCDIPMTPNVNLPSYKKGNCGGMYCQSTMVVRNYICVEKSTFSVNGIFGVNNGIPSAAWNKAACKPYVSFPVPYYLVNNNGTTQNGTLVVLSSVYDGTNNQKVVADPKLELDSSLTVIGDTQYQFVKNVIPIFPTSASDKDVDGVMSSFDVTDPLNRLNLKVKVEAETVEGQGTTMFTKVHSVQDMNYGVSVCAPGCLPAVGLPMDICTFKLESLGTSEEAQVPVYMTFAKNICKEYSVAFFHSVAAVTTAGVEYPPTGKVFTIPMYKMVGGSGTPCPNVTPASLLELYTKDMFDDIFSKSCALSSSLVATLQLIAGGSEVTPGNMTTSDKESLVHTASNSMLEMWKSGVDDFNAAMVAINT